MTSPSSFLFAGAHTPLAAACYRITEVPVPTDFPSLEEITTIQVSESDTLHRSLNSTAFRTRVGRDKVSFSGASDLGQKHDDLTLAFQHLPEVLSLRISLILTRLLLNSHHLSHFNLACAALCPVVCRFGAVSDADTGTACESVRTILHRRQPESAGFQLTTYSP